jgi:hypothetical protein
MFFISALWSNLTKVNISYLHLERHQEKKKKEKEIIERVVEPGA